MTISTEIKEMNLSMSENIESIINKVDVILDNEDDLKTFLYEKLASDWDKIRDTWQDYKDGKIDKKGLLKHALKMTGKKFLGALIGFGRSKIPI